MSFNRIEAYVSSESEEEVDTQVTKKRAAKRDRLWNIEKTFPNSKEAFEFLETEKTWGFKFKNETNEGNKWYYRCNKPKLRGQQCPAGVYLLFDNRNTEVVLFRADNPHDHNGLQPKIGLSEEAKGEIQRLFDLKQKPKLILAKLREKGIQVSNKSQITNYLKKLKQQKYGQNTISLGTFEQWCKDRSDVPDDEDKGFVAGYYVCYDDDDDDGDDGEEKDDDEDIDENENDGKKYRAIFTTKRLLRLAVLSNKIHADATYKLVYEGSPVLLNGNTDLDRHFHSFGISVCSNEKTADFVFIFKTLIDTIEKLGLEIHIEILVSDASEAIRNAFILVFGEGLLIIMGSCAKKHS
jgi:hypothetical protein